MLPVYVMDVKFENVEIDSSSHEVQADQGERKREDVTKYNFSRCYICYICQASFKRKACLVLHMVKHEGKQLVHHSNVRSLTCVPKEVANHKVERLFSCIICDKKLIDYQTLKIHEAMNHQFPHKCYICSKEFYVKESLPKHVKAHQKKSKTRFPCPQCKKTFLRQSLLDSHLRFHNKRQVFACKFCSKTFSQKGSLHVHMTVHTDKRQTFPCEFCSKTYSWKHGLRQHMSVHTEEGKNMQNVCQICHKTFSRKGDLQNHILNHKDADAKCKDKANVNCKTIQITCKKDADVKCIDDSDVKFKEITKANCKEDSYTKFEEDV